MLEYMSLSYIKKYWRSLDKVLFFLILGLFVLGIVTSLSVPSSNYIRLNFIDGTIISTRFLFFAILGAGTFIVASMLSVQWVRRLCVWGVIPMLVVLMLLPWIGFENKGAVRWLIVGGISVQPSEFAKPIFAVVSAWLFSARFNTKNIPGSGMSCVLFILFAFLFIIQPDLGQAVLLGCIWGAQLLVSGLSLLTALVLLVFLCFFLLFAYMFFPHVNTRIQGFLNKGNADTYQIDTSLEAFQAGGLFGQGLGNGKIKYKLPDSHTDFIFAVYGEEGGAFLAIFVLLLFGCIIGRMLWLIWHRNDTFSMIAMVGLCVQFAVQTAINIGSTTGLVPPKGMTLPLISMGGSSYVAIAVTLGVFMALSRRRKYED